MEERMKILNMVAEGKVSAQEAERLLQALEGGELNNAANKAKARWLKVRVYEKNSEKPKVMVNVPLALIKIGAKIGAKFNMKLPEKARRQMAEKGIDLSDLKDLDQLEKIIDSLTAEGPFKFVDVEEGNEKVEVYIE
ncbi:MAG: hypothetical protein ACE5JA_03485 [bacterium]